MPIPALRPSRSIFGASAVLLPLEDSGEVAWNDFERLLARTHDAGLTPAVNMDTGYANLIDEATRLGVLTQCQRDGRPFIGGVFVSDTPGSDFDRDAYLHAASEVLDAGGTPILFQSYGLTGLAGDELAAAYDGIGAEVGPFYAFELGQMFAPFGRIYSLDEYRSLLDVPTCLGAKHSSLRRQAEWDRLALRDDVRPDFRVLTGNDLAIDMVQYGSDYLLGLSAFHPEAFAKRDAYWAAGDAAFYELNDVLQYLGFFAFRDPVPAYKHSAAMFLRERNLIATSRTHPESPTRPASDQPILESILSQLSKLLD